MSEYNKSDQAKGEDAKIYRKNGNIEEPQLRKKRLKTKNPNFKKNEAENEEPQLQKK